MKLPGKAMCALLAVMMSLPFPSGVLCLAAEVGKGDASSVNFSFDQAELRLIIKIVGEITGKRFVIDDSVSGTVSVITPDNIRIGEVYPLLLSILDSSGYTVIEKENGIHVVPLPEGASLAGKILTGDETADGLVTKVIRINHISSVDLAKLLEPLVRGGKEGAVSSFGATNHLLITDTAESLRQIEKLIKDLDVQGASRTVEVIVLKHANADDLARQLIAAMSGTEDSAGSVAKHLQRIGAGNVNVPSDLVIVPIPAANSLVVVGTPSKLNQMRSILEQIDVEMPAEFGRLNAIFLKYMNAKDAAETLNSLLAKTVSRDQAAASIAIEHNVANNALIVESSPQDFELVKQLVEDLDRTPKQVMIEVVIAEVTLGEGIDLGVELSTIDNFGGDSTTFAARSRPGDSDVVNSLSQGIFPQGLAVGVTKGTYVDAAGRVVPGVPFILTALAENRDVRILSEIPLMAQNNEEASFSVVDNIPILTSSVEGTGDNRDIIRNIERIDVGTKLKIIPHINADNEVKLILNPSIEAIVDNGPPGTEFAPTIAKREVLTTVTVPDKATVIISGLIREDTVKVIRKIPLLGDIPLLGWLFRSKSDRIQKTNLLILATPHILHDLKDAEAVKEALEKRTSIDAKSTLSRPNAPDPEK